MENKQTSDIQYKTQDGEPCTLLHLIKSEPEWAESRINHMSQWQDLETAPIGRTHINGSCAIRVLILNRYGAFTAHNDGDGWLVHGLTKAVREANITHWMPLPKVPEDFFK